MHFAQEMSISHATLRECLAGYQRDGYALVRQLFGGDETDIVHPRLNERMARIARELLRADVYLHSPATLLGIDAWEWRQDYGYWYATGCLAPTMVSCMIAAECDTQNAGRLQVLRGSHTLGRIDHELSGEHLVADPARVKGAIDILERQFVTLVPGDALFLHCNLLHRLEASRSTNECRIVACSYNAESNRPLLGAATSALRMLERSASELGHFATHVRLGEC